MLLYLSRHVSQHLLCKPSAVLPNLSRSSSALLPRVLLVGFPLHFPRHVAIRRHVALRSVSLQDLSPGTPRSLCDSFSAFPATRCAVVPAAPFMVHYPRTMSVGWLVGIVQLHDIIGEMRPDNAACIPPHELMPRSWTEPNIYSKLLHRGSCSTLTKQQMSAAPSAAHLAVCVAAPVALLSVALPAEAFTSLAAVLFHSVPRSFSRVNSFARFMFRFSLCCFLVASLVSVVPVVTVRCAVLPLGPFGV